MTANKLTGGCPHLWAKNKPSSVAASYKDARNLCIKQAERSLGLLCQICSSGSVFACLECDFTGCSSHLKKPHHIVSNHKLAVDLTSGDLALVWCSACGQYVADFYDIEGTLAVDEGCRKPPFQATTGIRGLYNMGATCFMSVVLQSLLHNPIVRNYFLSGGHDRVKCSKEPCLACCIDEVFCIMYSSAETQGLGVTSFLTTAARTKRSLSGSSEQDAHEFLQFLLNELHACHEEQAGEEEEDGECRCPAHRAFNGELHSEIQCTTCHSTTVTVDPMLDISLEIKGKGTLEKCLKTFTAAEKISSYYCSKCSSAQTAQKRLTVKQLPAVLTIQLKRFQHLPNGTTSKIDSPVKFPLYLDMAEYTRGSAKGSGKLVYELFGVVSHQGSLNTGHYTCMMKARDGRWFAFDDAMVTKISAGDVVKTPYPYLLFYIVSEI